MTAQELIDYAIQTVLDMGIVKPEDIAEAKQDVLAGLAEDPKSAEVLDRIAAGLQRVQ